MAFTDWYVEGESFGNCNCGYACPCQFEELPTHGDCRGFEVLEISSGYFGETDLSGTKAALIYAWPGPIFEGGGEMQVIVDPAASPAQRDALEKVFHGEETEEMATHWYVFRAMCETVHDTLYLPIELEMDIEGRTASVTVGDVLKSTGRPIQAPHGGGEHRVRIDIPGGIEFTIAEIGSASTRADAAIKLDLKDSYGQWHLLKHGPGGVAH
ncbi:MULTISPECIES: DUF1326 domain-containing protein [unclassified Ruegeria]|uniref:DUF1326 domain-containing protein n=1 Tax=unclassified Ruegeria TaxID=2625375 RepID=UPI00148807E1|nr:MULTISPECIES: DUF1326 domain-containing protein [unclassified Ruegeria]NOC92085.1 DUF1326 domain-containing protein [Ruegeria sp. HKCCD6604]